MQYGLPIDGYAAEYNDDIEFFVACYQHTDAPSDLHPPRDRDRIW